MAPGRADIKSYKLAIKEIVMKYGDLTLGQLEALVNRVGGKKNALKVLKARSVQVEFVEHDSVRIVVTPTMFSPPELKVWKTIKLRAVYENGDDFCRAVMNRTYRLGKEARDILRSKDFTFTIKPKELDLVFVPFRSLGIDDYWRYDTICDLARKLGLELCPPEVGPWLRMGYPEQPMGETIVIAMNALFDTTGNLRIFTLSHKDDGTKWLSTYAGHSGYTWSRDRQFVFVLPRK